MTGNEQLFNSPAVFLSHFDQAESKSQLEKANFVKLSELDYRSPVFLQQISMQKPVELALAVDEFLHEYDNQKPVLHSNAHIFHSAFCCSTLLTNLVDYKGRTLVLREPRAYLQMANWKRGLDDSEGDDTGSIFRKLLAAISSAMAPGYSDSERSVIKHHNLVSQIIGNILQRNETHGLYIYSDLKSFIVSTLKSPARRSWLKDQIAFSYTDARTLTNLKSVDITKLDDVTAASYLWLINIAQYRLASGISGPRLCSLNNTKLLDDPLEYSLRVAGHLGLELEQAHIEEKIAHGVLDRHAKTPQLEYGGRQRKADLNKLSRLFKSEVKRGQKWAEKQAEFSLNEELPNPL